MGFLDKLFSKKPTPERFAKLVMAALEKSGASGVRFKSADFSIRVGSADKTFFLNNAFTDYCQAENEGARKSSLDRYVRSFLESNAEPGDFASDKTSLMAVVRDPAYFSLTELKIRADGGDPSKLAWPTKPLAPGLVAGVALDSANNIMSVNFSTLEKWHVGLDEALDIAVRNLRERTPASGFKALAPGLFVSNFGDCYDSARLLLPDVIYRLSLNGDPVIFAPNRDELWVTGRYDSANVATLLKYGPESHFKQGHSLSPNLYLLCDGELSDFLPEDPAQRALGESIRRQRAAMDYAQQTEYLNAIHEREHVDVFVGSYTLYKRKDETTFSMCVWSNTVDSLLPKTDSIVFLTNPGTQSPPDRITVPWDAAFPVVSPLLEELPGLAPIRYRARVFPDAVQISQLRGLAAEAARNNPVA